MYFWKIESLKSDLAKETFGDKELFPYMLLYVVFGALGLEALAYLPQEEPDNIWTYTMSVLEVLISIGGFILAYKCNGGGHGERFLSRYISISFVVFIWFIVYATPFMLLLFAYLVFSCGDQEEFSETFVEVAVLSVLLTLFILFNLRVAKHIRDVRKLNDGDA